MKKLTTFLLIVVLTAVLAAQNPVSIVQLGSATDVTTTVPISGTVTVTDGAGALNVIVDSGSITVNNGAGAAAVNIQDGGNSITVDGTVTVTATDLDIRNLVFATDKVDISGSTLGANSGVDIGDVTINNASGAGAVNIQDGGNSITIDGTVTANQGTPNSTANRWPIQITDGTDLAIVTTAGAIIAGDERSTTTAVTSVAGSASNVTCLASNVNRVNASVYNDSTADLFLKLGATASSTSFTAKIFSDGYFRIPPGYTGIIDCIWSSAAGSARVTEATP